jgi:hypothetical protein
MPQVALVANPRKRRRRRKMSALQRKYFGKRRHRRHRASSHRRRRRVATITVRANPRRHRRHAVHHRRYRRNPRLRIGGAFRRVIPTIQAGAIGAVGGLLNDVVYGFAKPRLPATLQAGWGRTGTKAVLAVFVGILGQFVLRGRGNQLAVGAATVVIHEALKEQLATLAPQLPLGDMIDTRELGYTDPAAQITDQSGQGAYMEQGAYMDTMEGM